MGVAHFPQNIELPTQASCVLCRRQMLLADIVAGPVNAEGQMTFICNGHFRDDRQLIRLLADYLAGERGKLRRDGDNRSMQNERSV